MAATIPGRRPITIQLDRERRLAFDLNAMAYIHDRGGINVLEGVDLAEFNTPARMRLLITACLQTDALEHGEDLTEERVGALVGLAEMVAFHRQIAELASQAFPDRQEGSDARPPEARRPSPGTTSGPSRESTSDSPTRSSGG